jgi:hypothetical protein
MGQGRRFVEVQKIPVLIAVDHPELSAAMDQNSLPEEYLKEENTEEI